MFVDEREELIERKGNISAMFIKEDFLDKDVFRKKIVSLKPHIIVNCFDYPEEVNSNTDKTTIQKFNVEFTENMIKASKILNAFYIHISDDSIFDHIKGPFHESDKPNPDSYLGKTKLMAENLIIPSQVKYAIVRVNNIYGYPDFLFKSWFDDIAKAVKENKSVIGYKNKFFNPTFVEDAARAIYKIMERKITGMFNIGSSDYNSHLFFCESFLNIFGLTATKIEIVDLEIPIKKGLITLKAQTALNLSMTSFEDSLLSLKYRYDKLF